MELKPAASRAREIGEACFNRTLMELKRGKCNVCQQRKSCFNRTLMELKHNGKIYGSIKLREF